MILWQQFPKQQLRLYSHTIPSSANIYFYKMSGKRLRKLIIAKTLCFLDAMVSNLVNLLKIHPAIVFANPLTRVITLIFQQEHFANKFHSKIKVSFDRPFAPKMPHKDLKWRKIPCLRIHIPCPSLNLDAPMSVASLLVLSNIL